MHVGGLSRQGDAGRVPNAGGPEPLTRSAAPSCRTVTVTPPTPPPLLKPGLPLLHPPRRASPRVPFGRGRGGRSLAGLPWEAGVIAPPSTSSRVRTVLAPRGKRETHRQGFVCPGPSPLSSRADPLYPPVRRHLERPVFPSHTMGLTSGPSLGALSTFCWKDPSFFRLANLCSSLQSGLFGRPAEIGLRLA